MRVISLGGMKVDKEDTHTNCLKAEHDWIELPTLASVRVCHQCNHLTEDVVSSFNVNICLDMLDTVTT